MDFQFTDIIGSATLLVTAFTLWYTIRLNKKLLTLSFRPYINISALANRYGYEVTHKDGLRISAFKSPSQLRFLKIYISSWETDDRIAVQKEIRGLQNEIIMPGEDRVLEFSLDVDQLEWLRKAKQNSQKLTISVLVQYTLMAHSKAYIFQKTWRYSIDGWESTKISAT